MDKRIYMIDENDHVEAQPRCYEFEVDMELLEEIGYLVGVWQEGPMKGEEFILSPQQEQDAVCQFKDILATLEDSY